MKLILTYITTAILKFFTGRRDLVKKIKLKAKNKQLERENAILDKQNSNTITDVDAADKLFARLRKRRK